MPKATRAARLRRLRARDIAETLAIDRAKALFGCGFANVQPHSGAQANQAVMLALLQPGDTILGMSLAAGGHLTHGAAPNLSGKWFCPVQDGVRRDDGLLDYDELERLARSEKPRLIIAGGPPIRDLSTSPASAAWPTRSARISWSIWRTSPAW